MGRGSLNPCLLSPGSDRRALLMEGRLGGEGRFGALVRVRGGRKDEFEDRREVKEEERAVEPASDDAPQ